MHGDRAMMLTKGFLALAVAALPLVQMGCSREALEPAPEPASEPAAVPDSAEETRPIAAGKAVPALKLKTVDGEAFDLNEAIAKKPTVLIFYRGGWCPFCTRQLAGLQAVQPQLKELGYQTIAVSPDRPAELANSIDAHELDYTLLSDSDLQAAMAFGLAFRVADDTVQRYTTYGIDLEAASGRTHHMLPVPAVFIIDTAGRIRFAFSNPDYKVRIEPETLLNEAEAALRK